MIMTVSSFFSHFIILRNSTKFAFMKRFFFMRMHVLHFFVVILRGILRNLHL